MGKDEQCIGGSKNADYSNQILKLFSSSGIRQYMAQESNLSHYKY